MERQTIWTHCTVNDVCDVLVSTPNTASATDSLGDLLLKFCHAPRTRHIYVTDHQDRLEGVIRLDDLIPYLFLPGSGSDDALLAFGIGLSTAIEQLFDKADPFAVTAGELMFHRPAAVTRDTKLAAVGDILIRNQVSELPVIDKEGKLEGEINIFELIQALLPYLQNRRQASAAPDDQLGSA